MKWTYEVKLEKWNTSVTDDIKIIVYAETKGDAEAKIKDIVMKMGKEYRYINLLEIESLKS